MPIERDGVLRGGGGLRCMIQPQVGASFQVEMVEDNISYWTPCIDTPCSYASRKFANSGESASQCSRAVAVSSFHARSDTLPLRVASRTAEHNRYPEEADQPSSHHRSPIRQTPGRLDISTPASLITRPCLHKYFLQMQTKMFLRIIDEKALSSLNIMQPHPPQAREDLEGPGSS